MACPDVWFPKQLDSERFKLLLVHLELEIAFDVFIRFREGAWADAAAKRDSRVFDAGLQSELHRGPEKNRWDLVQPDRDGNAGRYVVISPQGEIVGLLRVRRDGNVAVYANVLFRQKRDRQGVLPDAVLLRVLDWLREAGIREVTTGDVKGPKFASHVRRCGFSKVQGAWRHAF